MIARYTRKRLQEIWSDENRYRKWLDVEIAVCEAWAELGRIPKQSLDAIKKRARFSIERIEEIEAVTRHDVIAFVSAVAENVGDDARYIHLGLTSSDVLDTAYALLLRESATVLEEDVTKLMSALK
ncbi:MAG TPA: lyase family protein, partial [Deltaproteobacteria bacterium]|nr:lyase family protein [Deltaproteobacteria bacterium]